MKDSVDAIAEIDRLIAELGEGILMPLLPPDVTDRKRIQRHTLLKVLEYLEDRQSTQIDLTF